MLILTTPHLDITLDQFFFIQFTLVLLTWSLLLFVCGFKKVNPRACEDRVKADYFPLIPNKREP